MGGGSGGAGGGAGGNSSIGDGIGGYGTGVGTNGGGLGGLAGAIGAAGDAAAAAGMGSVSGGGGADVGGDSVIAPRQPGAPPSGTLLAPATDTLLSARGSANARKLSRRSGAATSSSQGGDGQTVSKTLLGS